MHQVLWDMENSAKPDQTASNGEVCYCFLPFHLQLLDAFCILKNKLFDFMILKDIIIGMSIYRIFTSGYCIREAPWSSG